MKKKRQSLVNRGVQLKLRDKYIKELREIEKKIDPEPQTKVVFSVRCMTLLLASRGKWSE